MRTDLCAPVLALLCLTALAGCTTEPYCEEYTKCGGDFTAGKQVVGEDTAASVKWIAGPTDACIDQVPNPPEPPSLAYIPPRPAGIRAVEPATIDWCAGLVINNMGDVTAFDDGWYETLIRYDGWFPSVPLYAADLTIHDNYQYSVAITQLVSQHTELTQTCLIAQGIVMPCGEIGNRLEAFVSKRLSGVTGLTATVYRNDVNGDGTADEQDAICLDDNKGGCTCDYNVSLVSGQQGPWADDEGRLAFFDSDAAPPARADYCVTGNSLQLTGARGTDLFNRHSLKTLELYHP
jgi:hypothetical protein